MAVAAEQHELERSYLLAERQLVTAQVRRLARLMAAQLPPASASADASAGGAAAAAAGGDATAAAADARVEAKTAEAQAAEAWERLPVGCSLRSLGGPSSCWKDLRTLGKEAARVVASQRRELLAAEQRAAEALRRLGDREAQCKQLGERAKVAAGAAAMQVGEAEARAKRAARERDAACEREGKLQWRLEELVSWLGAGWAGAVVQSICVPGQVNALVGNLSESAQVCGEVTLLAGGVVTCTQAPHQASQTHYISCQATRCLDTCLLT